MWFFVMYLTTHKNNFVLHLYLYHEIFFAYVMVQHATQHYFL